MPKEILQDEIRTPRPRRIFAILEAIRRNWPLEDIAKISSVDIWFLQEIEKSFNVNPENTPSSVLKMLGWTEEDLDKKESKNELENNLDYELTRQSLYYYNKKNQFTNNKNQPVITIPVVIHVIHRAQDAVGANTNIPNAQIEDQLLILNQDYSQTNPEFPNPPRNTFINNVGNPQIKFCLASIDPSDENEIASPLRSIRAVPSISCPN